MRTHRSTVTLVLAVLFLTPASPLLAQQERGGVRTETQERKAAKHGSGILWNVLGLFGLFGALGLRKGHDEDSYHPSSFD